MKKIIIKKTCIFVLYFLLTLYVLFLILPLAVNPFISSYAEDISKMAEEACGLKVKIEHLKIVTTPKLTIGAKIGILDIKLPTGEDVLSAENIQSKLSLLPLLTKKVEADVLSVDFIDANLAVKSDGNLQIIDYLPDKKDDETKIQMTALPLGLMLSNRLPNVYIKEYILSLTDMRTNKSYTVQGGNLKITDVILDKGFKFSTAGFAKIDGEELFNYNLKLANHIMPDLNLNDLVFAQNNVNDNDSSNADSSATSEITSSIFDILNSIKKNGLTAEIKVDATASGSTKEINIKGIFDIEKFSMLVGGNKLPDGHIKFAFKGKQIDTDIVLYTAENELTTIIGTIKHGNNTGFDIAVKSNAEINNIFAVIKSIASSLNYNDLESLSATGKIDADFSVKSDMKKVFSAGYFKVPSSTIRYGLYNIFIDGINADIDFKDNIVDFKNVGFKLLSQPLKFYGTISDTADADLHLTADKLIIKGLLVAAGQINLLKENDFLSGTLSADVSAKGNLKNIVPVVNLNVTNVNVLNKPTATGVKLDSAKIDLSSDGKIYKGIVEANSISVVNPAAKFILPKVRVTLDSKDVDIADTYLLMDNSRVDITGKIKDYTTKDILVNLKAKGTISATDIKNMLPYEIKSLVTAKGLMPLLVTVNGNDKKQIVNIQMLATPNGFFHIADLQSIAGKSMLINSELDVNGNSVNLNNTGIFATNKTSLSDNPDTNIGGTQILKVSGSIYDFANLKLKSLNVATVSNQTLSVPTFSNSKVTTYADITLNGNAFNPDIKGTVKLNDLDLPSIKTKVKNTNIDFSRNINVDIPLITIDNSLMNLKATLNPNFTKGIIVENADFKANLFDSDTMISSLSSLLSGSSSQNSTPSDIGIIIKAGNASITKFKTGKIAATNLTGDFNLKNNVFYLKNLAGNAFNGKITGNILCNVLKGDASVEMNGEGMDAVSAIEASAGIANALSGKLDFNADLKLNAFAPNFNDLLKSVKGSVKFTVKDGHYMNIGTIDQFVLAGNVISNTVMKAALLPIKNMPVVQSSSNFSNISGAVALADGIATLAPVKSQGKSLAYFLTGKYNIINGYTNVIILGRMGADLVAVTGPLGQLSVSKLASVLPSFGAKTLTVLSSLTSDPAAEKVSEIPALSDGSANYKDFKVVFNGNVTNPASVKSFKWLSDCDTTELENATLKEQMQTSVNTIKQSGINTINDAKKTAEDTKNAVKNTTEDIKNQVQKTKDSIEELKNLKNMFKTKNNQQTEQNSSNSSSSQQTEMQTTNEQTSTPSETQSTESISE